MKDKPTCADCGVEIGLDDGPRDGWQLEDGRTVCQACCAKDTRETYELNMKDSAKVLHAALTRFIFDCNQAAEDDDRGPRNDSVTLTLFDDGSGRIGRRLPTCNVVDDWFDFNDADEMIRVLEEQGIEWEDLDV